MDAVDLSPAKRALLTRLKRLGPTTAKELAAGMGTTDVAVRQHLQALEEGGLVCQESLPASGRGRPSFSWRLTDLAQGLFPDRHGELTASLLEALRQGFGEEGLTRLLQVRSRQQSDEYRRRLPARGSLRARVEALARCRSAEGYMAEVREERRGSYLLFEHHCPICEAAQACTGLCAAELDVFQDVLGEDIDVERTSHLLSDGDRCVYRIRKRPRSRGPKPSPRKA